MGPVEVVWTTRCCSFERSATTGNHPIKRSRDKLGIDGSADCAVHVDAEIKPYWISAERWHTTKPELLHGCLGHDIDYIALYLQPMEIVESCYYIMPRSCTICNMHLRRSRQHSELLEVVDAAYLHHYLPSRVTICTPTHLIRRRKVQRIERMWERAPPSFHRSMGYNVTSIASQWRCCCEVMMSPARLLQPSHHPTLLD